MEASALSNAVNVFVYVIAAGFAAIFAVVILKMMSGKIDLTSLLSEQVSTTGGSPKSSLSRFQLLVFTFVTAGLFLILSFENGQIIEIPNSVLGLLGISGGSYLISKHLSK